MYDVLIIGGGVIGTAIARELSRYRLKIALLEKADDLAMGTSKANSGIVHAGFDAKPGTLKAKTNLAGNPLFEQLSAELDFPFKRIGSLVLAFASEDISKLEDLKTRGDANGVSGLRVIMRDELLTLEPNIGADVVAALYAPTGGIVSPYEMTFALGENAAANGVEFFLNQDVFSIYKQENHFSVNTEQETYHCNVLINAAGVYADEINNCVSKHKLTIIPRAGEYIVFDRSSGSLLNHTLFQLPTKMGKGVLVTPTVDGNMLLGPTAVDLEDREDSATTAIGRQYLLDSAALTLSHIPTWDIITAFTGLRAHPADGDFIIEPVRDVAHMINVAGIESPGLTAAPAISKMVAELVGDMLPLEENPLFNPIRKAPPRFREMSTEEREAIIQENPLYGHVICRCEYITEGEIVEAICRPLGARNLDGVKRRVRAGMGRCQGGFCAPLVLNILARELGIKPTEITKFGGDSVILSKENRPLRSIYHDEEG